VFVEVSRLLVVVTFMLTGLAVGRSADSTAAATLAPVLGTLLGYVAGGVLGRLIDRALGVVEAKVEHVSGARLLTGALGALAGGAAGVVLAVPFVFLLPVVQAVLVGSLLVWTGITLGVRVAVAKSEDLFAMAGLSTRPLVRSSPYAKGDGHILDTSAVMDGSLGSLVRAGLVDQDLFVPRFVLDELQGFADAHETVQARRARAGLELLGTLQQDGPVHVKVLDDEVPEHAEVDAKLVALARRLEIRLLTCDVNLQRVAELQGVRVINVRRLAADLRPGHVAGETFTIELVRPGKEAGQGVGYLDDGSMVVVNGAAERIGETVTAEVTSTLPTSVGTLVFARLSGADADTDASSAATPSRLGGLPSA